ncbi:hypothetical protein [Saccharomonospora piscinae]|uniref:Integral membrane protein n=1 Tax=Saccharomonospora piscinae TaxID=687388 RepID=A0A1V9A790_SACPI|nr:hypothetical protein [Saccharomonospora piscinae]OQO92995.1 hypothetical protein B1813_12870 [Saccharomonospora piscinae]TLW93134.1 hypothetical protein FFT09_06815 [Saccharomonospora piscinae]
MRDRDASPEGSATEPPATASGPGRVLVAVYAIFAVGATSRAAAQIATRFGEAPVPYALSALAALVYVLATLALARRGVRWWRVAVLACAFEMTGVLVVGTVSVVLPGAFPDATVWSNYGMGYLFIPLVLPVFGLWWLRRTAPRR